MNNRRLLGWAIGIVVVAVVAITGLWLWHRTPETSLYYRQFNDMPGMEVGYVKDFPLSDSLRVGVTTFLAETDSAWNVLMDYFGEKYLKYPREFEEGTDSAVIAMLEGMDEDADMIDFAEFPHYHPEGRKEMKRTDHPEGRYDVLFVNRFQRVAMVYEPEDIGTTKMIVNRYIAAQRDGKMGEMIERMLQMGKETKQTNEK